MKLYRINIDGNIDGMDFKDEIMTDVCNAAKLMYDKNGYVEPWINYVAVKDATVCGTCGFKFPLADNQVEITYSTFPELEGREIGAEMVSHLVRIAFEKMNGVKIIAKSHPESIAHVKTLERLNFKKISEYIHPDGSQMWEWHLN